MHPYEQVIGLTWWRSRACAPCSKRSTVAGVGAGIGGNGQCSCGSPGIVRQSQRVQFPGMGSFEATMAPDQQAALRWRSGVSRCRKGRDGENDRHRWVSIPDLAALELQQTYEPIGGEMTLRTIGGSAIKQITGRSGARRSPAADGCRLACRRSITLRRWPWRASCRAA